MQTDPLGPDFLWEGGSTTPTESIGDRIGTCIGIQMMTNGYDSLGISMKLHIYVIPYYIII